MPFMPSSIRQYGLTCSRSVASGSSADRTQSSSGSTSPSPAAESNASGKTPNHARQRIGSHLGFDRSEHEHHCAHRNQDVGAQAGYLPCALPLITDERADQSRREQSPPDAHAVLQVRQWSQEFAEHVHDYPGQN